MTLRELEADSIREFVQDAADDGFLQGRVLDYGCGKQPYREIVEAKGSYYGMDDPDFPGSVVTESVEPEGPIWWKQGWDSILCTQVVQYIPIWDAPGAVEDEWSPLFTEIRLMARSLTGGGHLVLTYPTNWPEVETTDLTRFTKSGMERLLVAAGFEIVRHEPRAHVPVQVDGYDLLALGHGVIARA